MSAVHLTIDKRKLYAIMENVQARRCLRRQPRIVRCCLRIKFPPERKLQGGRPGKSNREMLNAIVYWLNTGIPWRDLPERFGPWQSVYSQFRAWTKAGVWKDIILALIEQDLMDETTLMLDSTTIKVHQHTSGAKKGDITRKPGGAGEA
ncbi:transposase [Acutalibacter intestini]|uniref:transposase n=1 Tax=Acutalibacter intestini TaxID=3093659 RepID=UPI002AC89EB7|nr:transposase [Acutalibacter sp. M00204]